MTLEQTLVIANPAASGGRSQLERLEQWLEGQHHCTLRVTQYPGDAIRFVQQAIVTNTRRFIIGGGDGTIHEVVSLLARKNPQDFTIGILPFGTGNDLARTLEIPLDFEQAAQIIRDDYRKPIDLIKVTTDDEQTHYVANAATGGVSERVTGSVSPAHKTMFGPLSYLVAAAGMLRKTPKYRIHLKTDGDEFAAETPTIVVANGRTAGGGHPVAPNAVIDDGVAEAVVATPRTRAQQVKLLLRLEVARHLDSDYLVHRSARWIELKSDPPMPFSLDGERLDPVKKLTFEVLPRTLNVIVPKPN
ncbi:MAG: diacylglycerol kinase family protein [Phycisphaeraceae bacterium]